MEFWRTQEKAMGFWRVEVKGGEPVIVIPGNDFKLHLSQAALELGDSKNGQDKDSAVEVPLFAKVDGKKLVLGTLSPDKIPQLAFEDLVFKTEFELSHNWNNGSVYFTGYKSVNPHQPKPAAASYPEAKKRKSRPAWADSDDSSSSEESLSCSPKKKAGLSNMSSDSDSDDSSDEEEEESLMSQSPKKKVELSSKIDIDSALGTTSGCRCRPGALGPRRRAAHTSAYDLWELIMTPSEGSTLVKTKNGWKLICS